MLSCNGDDRWRLSRRLAGGFRSCRLLRCTDPQFSAAQREVLVPFIACSFVSNSIAAAGGSVNSRFHEILPNRAVKPRQALAVGSCHNFHTCALLNATSPVALVSLEANRPIPPDRKVASFVVAMYCLFTYKYMLLPRAITVRRFC